SNPGLTSRPLRMHRAAPLLLVGIVSAAVLAYELLLTRILAVHYWSYFASMIVSLAMLGFAASGTALFLARKTRGGPAVFLPWAVILFIFSLSVCPWLSELIECIPLMVLWDMSQLGAFVGNYLVLSLPFLFGGYIIGFFFLSEKIPAGRVYFANMLGSGAGVLTALIFLCELRPAYALSIAGIPVVASAWLVLRARLHRAFLFIALVLLPVPSLYTPDIPLISQYKGMKQLLLMPDAEMEHSSWNSFGYVSVLDSQTIRYAPGLSLTYPGTIPEQKAIFINGGDRQVVCQGARPAELKEFFSSMLSGASYLFHDQPRVLIAGSGGGMQALGALAHGASAVEAVENNAAIVRLMTQELAEFSGGLYMRSDVQLIRRSARPYINATKRTYDIAVLPAKRPLFESAAGTSAQDPDYLLTQQALADFFSTLSPNGLMAVETWLNLPPRHSIKMFATAAAMLQDMGKDPGQHLVSIRSLRTNLLLIFREPVTDSQIKKISSFCSDRSFDQVYRPGITSETINKFNRVEGAPYHSLSRQILDKPQAAYRDHIFRIRPASDNRPYFSHLFKWEALPRLMEGAGRNVPVHIGWGYMFVLITLAQAIPLGALLILAPLSIAGRLKRTGYPHGLRICVYFAALGAAFMFIELTAIQQFVRFLPHPVYAFGTTIGLVLLFSGIGAFFSSYRIVTNRRVFTWLVLTALAHVALWQLSIHLRSSTVFLADVITLALLSFFMGMPFPRGISRLRSSAQEWIPWAWGINGFVSVLAALASGLAALSWGLTAAALTGVGFYLVAAVTFPPDH
ncbi:MAG: hypothetical protein ACOC6C_02720, partial [Verrucomicrobiota bacterium]